ncbi:uncharacterized protein LOC136012048 isoform X4 [Lathamus discolor]|uniref:uncharacterized protein LOC136012048 isoform X4 n=1 Tax=Lathamus discolor TaxID=678569 RepID=UPI0032B7446D
MVEISAVTASQCYICLQVCCFVVGVYFLVCIIRKLIHEERKKEVDIKQTTGMAIDFSGEWMTCLLQVSRPAAEYARSENRTSVISSPCQFLYITKSLQDVTTHCSCSGRMGLRACLYCLEEQSGRNNHALSHETVTTKKRT